ncbi:E3 ubiquitin/ISG15 ligase TRIM25-like [Scomber japonicus]|uniref:E3 ubiquitin/ISG15 ligase TRIM25-like n=1 Tax=Scomber japonicus TaxID=13676 RepID=UPI002306C9BD|nr:E3 ubiquitin/ISG15 ligase TRIM25-like [Scomber japonicus]
MAQGGIQLDHEKFCCSVCLDLLKDPVAIPCGHSYCMSCIKNFWDGEDEKKIYSCPQCRQTFTPRPVLMKNTMLADLVEQLKKTGLQAAPAAPADLCYAGPEDVACDVCTGRKLKAVKTCLQCLISYCQEHLQPHYELPAFKKHKLVEPSKKLQENICSRHDEVMKMFCRTDQQIICYLCSVDEHKGHDTVSAAAERTERQGELEVRRQDIQQRIQDREKDVKLFQQEVKAVSRYADKAVENSEKIFTELMHLLQKRRLDMKQQIRSQQGTEMRRVKELQEKLQQEITELKRKDAELEQLSHTEDHTQFLQDYSLLSCLTESIELPGTKTCPLQYFEDVTAAVSEIKDKLQDVLSLTWEDDTTQQVLSKELSKLRRIPYRLPQSGPIYKSDRPVAEAMDPVDQRVKPVEVELSRNLQTYLQRLGLLPKTSSAAAGLSSSGKVGVNGAAADKRFIQNVLKNVGRQHLDVDNLSQQDVDQLSRLIADALQVVDHDNGPQRCRGFDPERHTDTEEQNVKDEPDNLFTKLLAYLDKTPFSASSPSTSNRNNVAMETPQGHQVGLENVQSRTSEAGMTVQKKDATQSVEEVSEVEGWIKEVAPPPAALVYDEPHKKTMHVPELQLDVKSNRKKSDDDVYGYVITDTT